MADIKLKLFALGKLKDFSTSKSSFLMYINNEHVGYIFYVQ